MSQQINLFNPVFLKQKKHFSARTMLQGFGLIVAGVAVLYALQIFQLSALRGQERAMRVQAEQVTQRLMGAGGARASRAVEDQIRAAESELKTLQELAGAMQNEVSGGNEGFSRYLAAFARQPVNGLWLTGLTVAGDDLEVRGRALRPELLPVFIRRLSREEVLKGKGFAEVSVAAHDERSGDAKTEGPTRFVEFSLNTRDKRNPNP